MNEEKKLLELISFNIEKCQKILGDMIDDCKKFQSGLLPEEENVLPEYNYDKEAEAELEKDYLEDKKLEEGADYAVGLNEDDKKENQ